MLYSEGVLVNDIGVVVMIHNSECVNVGMGGIDLSLDPAGADIDTILLWNPCDVDILVPVLGHPNVMIITSLLFLFHSILRLIPDVVSTYFHSISLVL